MHEPNRGFFIVIIRRIRVCAKWVTIMVEVKTYSVKINEEDAEAFDAVVEESGRMQSAIHRRMIRHYLTENPDGWKVLENGKEVLQ